MIKFVLIIFILFVTGCDNCRNDDCAPRFDYFEFQYVSENGDDLLASASKKYELKDIKVYSLTSEGNKKFAVLFLASENPAVLLAELRYNTQRSFLEVKGNVTDTLDFKFQAYKSTCCPGYSRITEKRLNGIVYTESFPKEIVERI